MTRTLVLACLIAIAATSAEAQLSPLGGFIPYTVNTPAAGLDTSTGASAGGGGRCGWASQGRGGGRYICEDDNQRGENSREPGR
ncbi:hypothetical protein [Methylocapsa sp. S129]|uniref:hypothetical protein n=1 Tax=Methylocapsa sp. S129 TaxID=1641869 RepID=UPI00131B4B30|nr:hypothetical protein [Methylocapsa sp. S129]